MRTLRGRGGVSTAAERRKQARVAETLRSDLDRYFPPNGPCAFDSHPLGARHRVIDAIAGRVRAGEDCWDVAADYGVDVVAVTVALAVSW